MIPNKTRQGIDNVLAKTAGAKRLPNVKMNEYEVCSSGLVRATFELNHHERPTKEQVISAISNFFQNKLQAVANTFNVIEQGPVKSVISGVLSYTRETVPFREDLNGFRAVASNMYMDEEQSIWTLKSTECGQILVKANAVEDMGNLNELLAHNVEPATNIGHNYQTLQAVASALNTLRNVDGGEYVSYVNPKTERADVGVVVASIYNEDETDTNNVMVLSMTNPEAEPAVVDKNLITERHPEVIEDPELDKQFEVNASAQMDINNAIEYYRQVFQRNPEYAEMFVQRLQNHFA